MQSSNFDHIPHIEDNGFLAAQMDDDEIIDEINSIVADTGASNPREALDHGFLPHDDAEWLKALIKETLLRNDDPDALSPRWSPS